MRSAQTKFHWRKPCISLLWATFLVKCVSAPNRLCLQARPICHRANQLRRKNLLGKSLLSDISNNSGYQQLQIVRQIVEVASNYFYLLSEDDASGTRHDAYIKNSLAEEKANLLFIAEEIKKRDSDPLPIEERMRRVWSGWPQWLALTSIRCRQRKTPAGRIASNDYLEREGDDAERAWFLERLTNFAETIWELDEAHEQFMQAN